MAKMGKSSDALKCASGIFLPTRRLLYELAETADADLIIIATHGAKGLEKILLGSVAERVLKRAHCPVLIMNPFKKQKNG